MTIEQRLVLLEKEVAELKKAVQPEQVAEKLADRIQCALAGVVQVDSQEIEQDKEKVYKQESVNWKRILSYAIRRNLPRLTVTRMKTLIRQLDEGAVGVVFAPNDNCQN